MRHRRTSYLVLALVVASLGACASPAISGIATSGPTASAPPSIAVVQQLMRASGASATSVHVKGDYTDKGQALQLDVAGDRAGRTMRLLVDFGAGPIEILKVGGDFYLKADKAFWTRLEGSAATAVQAAGRYVSVPAGSAAGMGDFTVSTLLAQVFTQDVPAADKLSATVQATQVDGVPAYAMTTSIRGDAKIYVSADGRARLLRTESTKNGTLDFSDWDAVAPLAPPLPDQVVTIAGLSAP
jgi:hypothetical protein